MRCGDNQILLSMRHALRAKLCLYYPCSRSGRRDVLNASPASQSQSMVSGSGEGVVVAGEAYIEKIKRKCCSSRWRACQRINGKKKTGPCRKRRALAKKDIPFLSDERARKQLFVPTGRSECIPKCHVILLVAILRPPYVYAPLHLSFIFRRIAESSREPVMSF